MCLRPWWRPRVSGLLSQGALCAVAFGGATAAAALAAAPAALATAAAALAAASTGRRPRRRRPLLLACRPRTVRGAGSTPPLSSALLM